MLCLDPLGSLLPASRASGCFSKLLLPLMACVCDSAPVDGLWVAGAPVSPGAESGKCLRFMASLYPAATMITEGGKRPSFFALSYSKL